MRNPRFALVTATIGVLALSGCTAGASAPTPTSAQIASSPAATDATSTDQFSPLIVSTVAPDPVPVHGTDGLVHLVYELEILNASPRPASIADIVTSANGETISTMTASEVVARTIPIGDYPYPPVPVSQIPPGTTVVVLLDTTFTADAVIPGSVQHRIDASFGDVRAGQANYATLFPTQASAETTTTVGAGHPIVIGPPLRGGDWIAVNACCTLSVHRGSMVPVGGRINGAERYAIDWSRFDLSRSHVESWALSRFTGDPTVNANYLSYDQPVLAVGDGEVVVVSDNLADAPARVLQSDLPLNDYGGNYIVLKLAEKEYAFYAHLKPGSVRVRVGDRVSLGDEIARTGNSGNTTEAHLHFHMMDGVAPLTSTNLPFEISAFTMLGDAHDDGTFSPLVEQRKDELPLIFSAVRFPG